MKSTARFVSLAIIAGSLLLLASTWRSPKRDDIPSPTPRSTTYEEFLRSLPPELLNVAEGIDEEISDLQDRKNLVMEIHAEAMNGEEKWP